VIRIRRPRLVREPAGVEASEATASHVNLAQFLPERGPDVLEQDGTAEPARAQATGAFMVSEHAFSIRFGLTDARRRIGGTAIHYAAVASLNSSSIWPRRFGSLHTMKAQVP